MDYRNLLKKYIERIGICEGIYYLDSRPLCFDENEYNELLILVAELKRDYEGNDGR